MLCLKTKTLLCIHFPLSLNYFHPDFSGLCSTKLMHSGDPETTFPLTVCDCLGWRRIISQMAMRQCCHVHMKDVVGQEVRLCCFFKRHIFFSLWFTCPLLWASIEPSLTHPPLLRPWWGSDLEQNIWRKPSCLHLQHLPLGPLSHCTRSHEARLLGRGRWWAREPPRFRDKPSWRDHAASPTLRLCCLEAGGGCWEGLACRSFGHSSSQVSPCPHHPRNPF